MIKNDQYMEGTDLKRRRLALGMTQVQLAERWSMDSTTISKWETGACRIDRPQLVDDALCWLETGNIKDEG